MMLRLMFEGEDEPVFIKFKLKKDYDNFMNSVYAESGQLKEE